MSGTNRLRNRVSLFALVAGVASFAQAANAAIETVVVTAERRTENLQTTAISASGADRRSAFGKRRTGPDGSAIRCARHSDLRLLLSQHVQHPRHRSVAAVDIDLPSGVVIYRDGVPTLTGYFQNAPYYDMAGVEVLRGPQGTFAGKAAAAGAVFIRTADPELDNFSAKVMVGGGTRRLLPGNHRCRQLASRRYLRDPRCHALRDARLSVRQHHLQIRFPAVQTPAVR